MVVSELHLATALIILPVQLVATCLCALSLWWLRPGPSFLACLGSRWLRDAGGNLLVFAPGLGEIAGARVLVLAGSASAAAVSASALDVLAETVAQIPFAMLGLFAVPRLWTLSKLRPPALESVALFAILGAGTVLALFRMHRLGWVRALLTRVIGWLTPLREAFAARGSAMPSAIFLHLLAWASGGFQVFLAVKAIGGRLSLGASFIVESFVYAVRGIFFIVPAGLGVQEASLVAVGLIFGLTADQGLAVSILLRARDLVLGAPALIAWPAVEALAGRRARRAAQVSAL